MEGLFLFCQYCMHAIHLSCSTFDINCHCYQWYFGPSPQPSHQRSAKPPPMEPHWLHTLQLIFAYVYHLQIMYQILYHESSTYLGCIFPSLCRTPHPMDPHRIHILLLLITACHLQIMYQMCHESSTYFHTTLCMPSTPSHHSPPQHSAEPPPMDPHWVHTLLLIICMCMHLQIIPWTPTNSIHSF